MKADTPVEKLKNSFSTGACKTLRVSHSFHRLDDNEPKTTKPDTSLATETGHFHLLLTLNPANPMSTHRGVCQIAEGIRWPIV